ncbi:MAG TPA: (2Fe-2S)-binding protein [Longimicrobiales bacterium]|nr:(2Fe-2S)-binding protein [Longimicrobiales bacterium]
MSLLELHVNGEVRRVDVDPSRTLLSVLRDDLDLTGSKYGCGEGQCGACTVLLDGRAVRSCVTPVASAAARPVVTIEGLARGNELHPVQQAFIAETALQCGYCTTGMVLSSVALLSRDRAPGEAEIRRALDGNVCRCGTYPRIVAAVRRAAAMSPEAGHV